MALDADKITTEELQRKVQAAKRLLAINEAKEHLIDFIRFTMPDAEDPEDVGKSMYEVTPQARLLCEVIEKVVAGKLKRVAVSIGPQLGKSEVLTRRTPAWILGKKPSINIMAGTYNQDFANQFGADVRAIIESQPYKQIFPKVALRDKSKDFLSTIHRGKLSFIGVGASGTGKAADLFIVDDPFKNDEEAQSEIIREAVWKWFTSVAFTRIHRRAGVIVVQCMTGDTRVLMADGSHKCLRDVKVGDSVATYKDGKISVSAVLNWANQGPDSVFSIATKSGVSIRANERHPFLVDKGDRQEWVKLRDLKIGDNILRVTGESGEGSPALRKDVMSRPSAKVSACLTTIKLAGRAGHDRHRTMPLRAKQLACVAGTESARKSTRKCAPNRTENARCAENPPARMFERIGVENCASITTTKPAKYEVSCATTAISRSGMARPRKFCSRPLDTFAIAPDEVVSITAAGREDVYDIQVCDTENFIANGLVSHNTRWHEDDLIGRLCDPTHPERNKKYEGIADDWTYIDIPAVITDPDLAKALGLTLSMPTDPRVIREFGRAVQVDPKDPAKVVYKPRPMVALWENRKDLPFLAEARRLDPRVFDALYMGKPTPDEGYYFKKQDIVEYDPADLPRNLEKYAASDHATSEKQENDPTVLGCVGVDHNSHIWVLPDLVWDRMETDRTVEEIIAQMQLHRPNLWWMENELISKSFGPFLRKRMMETQTYTVIDPVTPTKDKRSRARAIQGRMQMRMVHFPRFAPWWKDAKAELLKFPFGAHDDLVDFLSMIGLGLLKELDGRSTTTANDNARPRSGSIEWILAQTKRNAMKSPNGVYKGWRVG